MTFKNYLLIDAILLALIVKYLVMGKNVKAVEEIENQIHKLRNVTVQGIIMRIFSFTNKIVNVNNQI